MVDRIREKLPDEPDSEIEQDVGESVASNGGVPKVLLDTNQLVSSVLSTLADIDKNILGDLPSGP